MPTAKTRESKIASYNLFQKSVAEFMGTFVLVLLGCGTLMLTDGNVIATALALGLAAAAMYCAIGSISGGHINPAVSLGKLLARKMGGVEFAVYVAAQVLGAIAAALLLFSMFRLLGVTPLTWATNGIAFGVGGARGYIMTLIIESAVAFVFVYVFLCVTSGESDNRIAGIAIGITFALVALFGMGITGAAANPARSIGPALMSAIFRQGWRPLMYLWMFIVAPLIGAAVAAIAYVFLNRTQESRRRAEG